MASGSSCTCLVIVTANAAVISLAFVIMTVLYSTQGSLDCGATVFSGDSKQAVSTKVTHFDILNMDKFEKGDSKVKDVTVDEKDGKQVIFCDCGSSVVFGLFETVVFIAIFVGMSWMTCSCCGQARNIYQDRYKKAEMKKKGKEKAKIDNLRRLLRNEMEMEAGHGSQGSKSFGETIDTDLS